MKKPKTISIVTFLLSIAYTKMAYANPMPIDGSGSNSYTERVNTGELEGAFYHFLLFFFNVAFTIFILCLATAMVESLVAFFILKKYLVKGRFLFKPILKINLITLPVTLVVAALLAGRFGVSPYFAELIPFSTEFFLLKWQLGKLDKNKLVSPNNISDRDILIAVFAMNIVSFLMGFLL